MSALPAYPSGLYGSSFPIAVVPRRWHDEPARRIVIRLFCANVIQSRHGGLPKVWFAGCGRYLRADGRLFLYGLVQAPRRTHSLPATPHSDKSLREKAPHGACAISGFEKRRKRGLLILAETSRCHRQTFDSGVRAMRPRPEQRFHGGGALHHYDSIASFPA